MKVLRNREVTGLDVQWPLLMAQSWKTRPWKNCCYVMQFGYLYFYFEYREKSFDTNCLKHEEFRSSFIWIFIHWLYRKRKFSVREDTQMMYMKIDQFLRPSTPHVHLCLKFFHPLDFGRPISNEPPHTPIDNQLIKRKHNPRMTIICHHAHPFGRLSFSVSTHLSCLAFLWLLFIGLKPRYLLFDGFILFVCAVVQIYQETSVIYNYSHF